MDRSGHRSPPPRGTPDRATGGPIATWPSLGRSATAEGTEEWTPDPAHHPRRRTDRPMPTTPAPPPSAGFVPRHATGTSGSFGRDVDSGTVKGRPRAAKGAAKGAARGGKGRQRAAKGGKGRQTELIAELDALRDPCEYPDLGALLPHVPPCCRRCRPRPPLAAHCRPLPPSRVEAPVGIEPTNRGFADLRLTTWLRRRTA